MTRSIRFWVVVCILLLVAVNALIFYPTPDAPLSLVDLARLRTEFVEKERQAWAKSNLVSLADANLDQVLRELESESCLTLPEQATPIEFADLSEPAQQDLLHAIAGLCRAYLEDTGRSVVEYMHSRGESFAPERAKAWRSGLQSKGRALPAANDEFALAEAIYQSYPMGAHWESLRPAGSCWRLYTVAEYSSDQVESIGSEEVDAWQGVASSRHAFAPQTTWQEELRRNEELVLCDLKLVIDHDQSLRGVTVPYYFRFWWSESDNRWHPVTVAHIPNDVLDMGTAIQLFF